MQGRTSETEPIILPAGFASGNRKTQPNVKCSDVRPH